MKKILPMLLVLCLLLTGCGDWYLSHVADGIPEDDGLTIVATNYFLYDTARQLVRPEDEVIMLISPGAESHDFELTLADMALLETCDLFVYVGGEGEGWVYDALETFAANGIEIPAYCAMETVEKNGTLLHAAGEHTHDHDHAAHGENRYEGIDDHVWLSIPNALAILRDMADALRSRYTWSHDLPEGYLADLALLDEKFRALTASVSDPVILVADRFPFAYLTGEYGISYTAAFEGCTSDTEASLETIHLLMETVTAKGLDTIFVTELSDRQTAQAVAAQTGGLEIAELHSCHNVTQADFDAGISYYDLMCRNYAILEKVWNP